MLYSYPMGDPGANNSLFHLNSARSRIKAIAKTRRAPITVGRIYLRHLVDYPSNVVI